MPQWDRVIALSPARPSPLPPSLLLLLQVVVVLKSLQIGDAIVLKAADIGLYNFARFTRLRLVTQTCALPPQVCVTSLRRVKRAKLYRPISAAFKTIASPICNDLSTTTTTTHTITEYHPFLCCNKTVDVMQMRCKCKIFIHHVTKSPTILLFQTGDVTGLQCVLSMCSLTGFGPRYVVTTSSSTTTTTTTRAHCSTGQVRPIATYRIVWSVRL